MPHIRKRLVKLAVPVAALASSLLTVNLISKPVPLTILNSLENADDHQENLNLKEELIEEGSKEEKADPEVSKQQEPGPKSEEDKSEDLSQEEQSDVSDDEVIEEENEEDSQENESEEKESGDSTDSESTLEEEPKKEQEGKEEEKLQLREGVKVFLNIFGFLKNEENSEI